MKGLYLCVYYNSDTGKETTFVEEYFDDIIDEKKHPALANKEWMLVGSENALSIYEAILVLPCGDRITIEKVKQLKKGEKHHGAI